MLFTRSPRPAAPTAAFVCSHAVHTVVTDGKQRRRTIAGIDTFIVRPVTVVRTDTEEF